MCVCVCVCVSSWHMLVGWADVGLWVAVCFLAKISLYIGLHVKPRLHAWHSHRQSRSHFAFSSLSDQWEIQLFFIFRNSFLYKITVSFTMVIKRSPGGPCRWRAVNFEIHLWSSGMNADCIWRSISIQHVQREAGLNSDPGNDSFWDKSMTLSMLIDLLTSTCRSTQVNIASTDLWPQGMLRWSSRKAVLISVPTSVIGGLGASQRLAILLEIHVESKSPRNWVLIGLQCKPVLCMWA